LGLLCVVLLDLRVQGDFQVFNAAHTTVVESTASLSKKSVLSNYLMPLPSLTSKMSIAHPKFVSRGRTGASSS